MAGARVELVLYDNRYDGKSKPSHLLYRSATALNLSSRVGSLVPASTRPWLAGDREAWLLQQLPTVEAHLAVLLDASDAIAFCGADEIEQKWRWLAGPGKIVVGAETQMWPEETWFSIGGQKTRLNVGPSTKGAYPTAPIGHIGRGWVGRKMGTPFRYLNIGLLAGAPADLLSLLRCMDRMYQGFPRQCPVGRWPNGTWEYVSDAPHRTRFGLLSGHWGWEQSCFHYYLMQQTFSQLDSRCPQLVPDFSAELVFNSVKSLDYLTLPTNGTRPHINAKAPSLHGVRPCIVHANSAAKPVLPVLQTYWERFAAPTAKATDDPLARPVPPSKAELMQLVERDWRPDDNAAARTLNPRHVAQFLKLFDRTGPAP